jgi:DNA-binding transcriptional LysR family regulator
MELRQLRYFLEIARTGGFTRAAERLSIAQPALSQQIAALERQVGTRLFERTNRMVRLTDAGRALVPRAERVIDEVRAAQLELAGFAGGLRGRVAIGTYQSFAERRLPKLLGRYHQLHPGIEIALQEGMADELLAKLREGGLDLFVGELQPPQAHSDLATEPLFDDELAIAVSPNHRLASHSSVRIDELRDEPFVVFRPGSSVNERLQAAARAAGFRPRVSFESIDTTTIRGLVAEGLGIALFPRALGTTPGPKIALLSLAPEPMIRRMLLVTRHTTPTPAAESFMQFLREAMQR